MKTNFIIRIINPFYIPKQYRGLGQKQLFELRFREIFGINPTEEDWETFTSFSREGLIDFLYNISIRSLLLSAAFWSILIVATISLTIYYFI